MITQSHIGEARANAQNFNDFNLDNKDNFRLQYILTKLSLLKENLGDNSFDVVLKLREGEKITQEDLDDLIKGISLMENINFYTIADSNEKIIDFFITISDNLIILNSDVIGTIKKTKELADAGF